jgi:hypothetical protein
MQQTLSKHFEVGRISHGPSSVCQLSKVLTLLWTPARKVSKKLFSCAVALQHSISPHSIFPEALLESKSGCGDTFCKNKGSTWGHIRLTAIKSSIRGQNNILLIKARVYFRENGTSRGWVGRAMNQARRQSNRTQRATNPGQKETRNPQRG